MPGKSDTTVNQQSKTEPWAPTQPALQEMINKLQPQIANTGLTGTESTALDKLGTAAAVPSQYTGDMQGLLANLFKGGGIGETSGMVKDAYGTLQKNMNPTASGDFLDPTQNKYLQSIVGRTTDDIRNNVAGQFAGAGRSFSGAHLGALGTGIGKATQDLYYNDYNAERARQADANKTLFTGATTASGALESMAGGKLGAQMQAPGLLGQVDKLGTDPYMKQLEVEAMRRGIPLQNMGMLASLLLPIASLGKQQTGTSTSSTETDPWQNIFKGLSFFAPGKAAAAA